MKRYNMVMLLAIVLIPVALFAIPVAESKVATSHASSLTKQINWSGIMWNVRSGSGGPGPNVLSSSTNNVWVDSNKKLHLKITKSNNKWYCAEISTVKPAKYGTYKFTVDSDPSKLSKDVVSGMFYYLDYQN